MKEYNFCYGFPNGKQVIELKNKIACFYLHGSHIFFSYDEAFS